MELTTLLLTGLALVAVLGIMFYLVSANNSH